jgi:hypothetical protein
MKPATWQPTDDEALLLEAYKGHIRGLISEDKLNLARAMGIGYQSLSNKLHGRTPWSREQFEAMRQWFKDREADSDQEETSQAA